MRGSQARPSCRKRVDSSGVAGIFFFGAKQRPPSYPHLSCKLASGWSERLRSLDAFAFASPWTASAR
jgi:hypothetical protein